MLAMKSVSPLIANTMEDLQTWANRINSLNINSCETAAELVGSIWPKTDVAQQQVCQHIGMQRGLFSDWAAARQGCGNGGQRSQILSHPTDEFRDMALQNVNIAWRALKKNAFLAQDSKLAELFLSFSGSIIAKTVDDQSPQTFKILPSIAGDRQLINALLHGGMTPLYHCDTQDQCLNPTRVMRRVSPQNALSNRIKDLLQSLLDHLEQDTALSAEEIGLLQATPLPIYKILSVESAYRTNLFNLEQYSDLIAMDIVYQYIQESLAVIRASAATLQYPSVLLDRFMKGIQVGRTALQMFRRTEVQQRDEVRSLIAHTQALEKQLMGRLATELRY
jgi:conjugative transfer pilus assembly protein TraH